MQLSHAARNARNSIKNPRARNNANLLSIINIINKAILSVTADKVTRKNDSKE